MKNINLFVLLLFVVVGLSSCREIGAEAPSYTPNRVQGYNSTWAVTKGRVLRIRVNDEYCATAWDMVWPWAKAGNLEARHFLHRFLVKNIPTRIPILPPGEESTGDSFLENAVTLAIYAHDHSSDDRNEIISLTKTQARAFYKKVGLSEGRGKRFFGCVEGGGQNCMQIAIEDGIVDPYEVYAERIDRFLKNGIKAKCLEL